MPYDMLSKWSNAPKEIECGQDGCKEMAWLVEDEGQGYCGYECPTHGAFSVQFDWDEDEQNDEY